MAISPDFKLKVRHFIRDNYKPIILIIVILLILILINRFLMGKRYSRTASDNI